MSNLRDTLSQLRLPKVIYLLLRTSIKLGAGLESSLRLVYLQRLVVDVVVRIVHHVLLKC